LRRKLTLTALLLLSACRERDWPPKDATVEAPPLLGSLIQAGGSEADRQLLKGFHGLEQGSWRWTMGRFSVLLRPPAGVARDGGQLRLKCTVPEIVLQKLGPTSLQVSVAGTALSPIPLSKAGEQEVLLPVPAAALAGDAVTVDFALSRYFAAGEYDGRELGIIFSSAALERK
jgi:hypothetical protein